MQISRNIVVGAFLISIGFMAAASFIAYPMLEEVNGMRPPSDQYPDSSFRSHFFKVWKEHEKYFPSSRRRLHFVICLLAAVACFLAGVCVFLL